MSGSRRLVLSGIALTVLLALVALASHAHKPGGGTGGGTSETPKLIFEYGATVMFILLPFGIITVLWVASLGRRQKLIDGDGVGSFRAIFTFGLVAIPLAYLIRHFVTSHVHPRQNGSVAVPGSQGPANSNLDPGHAATGQFHWVVALIAGSLVLALVVGVVAAVVAKRLRGDDWAQEAALSAALDEVLADTLDDLRAEKSPRRAVIRAFARMEKTFAAHNVQREPSETPREYVERALDRLGVSSASVRQLTKLYERAKFSRLEIDEGMKTDAIAALAGVRAELVEPDALAAA
jgi:uncharacterized protein DUF4129